MQIQLKQKEIEAALRGYIIKQGINMEGRTLDITFTSGRKDNGLSADLNIEDSPIPGFSKDDDYDEVAPVPPEEPVVASPAVAQAVDKEANPAPTPEPEPMPVAEEKKSPEVADTVTEEENIFAIDPVDGSPAVEQDSVVEVKKPLSIFG